MRAAALLSILAVFAPLQDGSDPKAEADRLYEVATSGNPRVRYQAALRLAGLGEVGAKTIHIQLERDEGYLGLGPALYEALVEFEDTRLRAEVWVSLQDEENPWRPAGARALAKQPRAEEAARFQALLKDPISAVRAEAIAGVAAGEEAQAVHALNQLLEDSNGRVRRRAAASLAGLGQHRALAWLLEDLRRDDSWFDMRLGRIARAEAAQALNTLLGRDALSQYSSRKSPYTDENVAAIAALEERCKELAGDDWPTLPEIACAPSIIEGEVIGIELRSCRFGEHLLRWTADDRLVIGEGDKHILALPEGATAKLLMQAQEALKSLGTERSFGDPGCDLERHHIRLPGEARATTLQLSKGPAAVIDLRPAALDSLAAAMVASASTVDDGARFAALLTEVFEALGGSLSD
jgi:hypothetical protein